MIGSGAGAAETCRMGLKVCTTRRGLLKLKEKKFRPSTFANTSRNSEDDDQMDV